METMMDDTFLEPPNILKITRYTVADRSDHSQLQKTTQVPANHTSMTSQSSISDTQSLEEADDCVLLASDHWHSNAQLGASQE